MKTYVDRKRAASGERDEGEETVLAPVESLVAALNGPKTERRSSEENKAPVERPGGFVERRNAFPKQQSYNPVPVHLRTMMKEISPVAASKVSYHIGYDRELVAVVGPSDREDKRRMAADEIHFWDLNTDPMENHHNERVMTKLHPMVYYFDLLRDELVSNTVVFELALYSRVIGSEHKDYLGKTKVYFARPGNEKRFWVNLAKIK